MRTRGKFNRTLVLGTALAASLTLARPLFAVFQSVKVETIGAACVTGGVRIQFLKISHTPIIRGSPNTKKVVIVGETGFETPPNPMPYVQRLTVNSTVPPQNRLIRVWVEYRFLPPLQAEFGEVVKTPVIEGPDPFGFAFQIDPSSVTVGRLQYRIVAQRINGGVAVSTKTTSYPPVLADGTTTWLNVGVQANAVESFGIQGGRFTLLDGNPADGETSLDIPRGLLSELTAITLDELPTDDPSIPPGLSQAYRVYRIDSENRFKNGTLLLSLLYPDFEYPLGQDGIVDGTNTPEAKVGIAWWDGFIWRPIGGTVNAQSNLVTAKIASAGYYAVGNFPAPSPEDRRPMQKIITPNDDGHNDYAEFLFAGVTDNIKVEIFDMTGHRIRSLYSAIDTKGWDGRDDSGDKVESGVYIYQYKFEGKQVSGLIAVAK